MDPLYFQAFCFQKEAVNEAIVQLESTDATTSGPQEELFGVFYSMWKTKYHEIYRKTNPRHSLVQWKTDLNKPFRLGSATNSVCLY